ncbi:N-acetylmuramoyl-L-alanine amidase [Actinomadura sp. 21ATH]|uniref:N-acetylmuramoyl-L-alanine amidase n=1 Tax=Actinomadura sp. 21ATH TaxID=1735444 RepID=UPI0035BFF917
MRIHSAAALALCLGALTACGGDGGSPPAEGASVPPPTSESTAPQGAVKRDASLQGKVIVIDPGHNGGNGENASKINKQVRIGNGSKACDTTGTATNDGYNEHAFTWDVSKRLAKLLKAKGAEVHLTRSNDTGWGPCITERAALGNRVKADAALSVHADGAPASSHGFHIIQPIAVKGYNSGMVPDSQRLGRALRDAYHEGTGVAYSNYRGKDALDPRNDLGGLNLSRVPKVFIECGNMRNAADAAKMKDAGFRQRIATSLVQGFEVYFRS